MTANAAHATGSSKAHNSSGYAYVVLGFYCQIRALARLKR